ncbi:MAG: methyltransferase [Chloroflexota bacterium]
MQTGSRYTGQGASPGPLLELIGGKWLSQAISVAAELGIADFLKDGPRSAAEIADMAGASEDAVFRLLRALAGVGCFSRLPGRRFALAPLGEYLRSDVSGSLRGYARYMGHHSVWRSLGELLYSVQTGKPAFDHVFGMGVFDYLAKDTEAAGLFNDGATSLSTIDASAVAEGYDFSGISTLVDVGGGHGLLLATILKANPGMSGILFELPHVVQGATSLLQREGVASRCPVISGDFFESIPLGGDAYIMKGIIHDWGDDRSSQILRNCHRVMSSGAKLLVVDRVISASDESDIRMLVMTPGGRERTEAEFRQLYEQAGFQFTRVVSTTSPRSVIEGIRL